MTGASLLLKVARWIPAMLCMGAIFAISSQPKPPELPFLKLVINGEDHSDKVKHAIAYAILGGLFWRALQVSPKRRRVALAVALAVLYGLTDEWHQDYVPGRDFDLWDLAADTLGAAVAALSLSALCTRKRT